MIARFAIPFFFLMALVVVPAAISLLCRWLLPRKAWRHAACACTFIIWCLTAYGYLVGFQELSVRRVELSFSDLPEAFDGYRIVQFSDAHVGTYSGSRQWLLQRAVDSINSQQPDAIVFTGDLQNLSPDEVLPHMGVLSQLKARDGVFSVLGNHDYPMYMATDDASAKAAFSAQTRRQEQLMGWQLLDNSHCTIERTPHGHAPAASTASEGTEATDHAAPQTICMAGMANWGKAERMPREGDVSKTMSGVPAGTFTIMLQHDPTAWREKILPESHAQLTLSGHTHGGQMALCGWSPVQLAYREWGGVYSQDGRVLNVSTGLGALIPFRLGLPGEIVVITLRKKPAAANP